MSNIDNKTQNILLLESIRAGIPSKLMIENLPDLREKHTNIIDEDLEKLEKNISPQGRIIWGEYGQGKTHFLKMVEQYVLSKGFAVSYYTLNRDLGLNNLKNLFPVLAGQTMTGNNKIPGIMNCLGNDPLPNDLTQNIADMGDKISHPLPAYMLQAFLSFKDADEMMSLYNSITGNSKYWTSSKSICRKVLKYEIKNMPKFSIKENSIAFFEFFPHLLKMLGFKGWIILLDEIELIGKLGKIGRLNSYLNLSYLLNWSKEHSLPIYTLAASAKTLQTDVFYSKKKDFNKMPEAAMEKYGPNSLALINNFFTKAFKSTKNLNLNPIRSKEFLKLFQSLIEIHQKAIDWQIPPCEELANKIIKIIRPEFKPVRVTIRMMIELLDIYAVKGTLVENITEEESSEYDLNNEDFNDNEETSGLTEQPLSEMFDEV